MTSQKTTVRIIKFILWVGYIWAIFYLPSLLTVSGWVAFASALPFIIKIAYDYFDGFNLLVNRLIMWLFNLNVAWEMKARFRGDFYGEDIERITSQFKQIEPTLKILQSGEFERTLSIPAIGVVVKLSVSSTQDSEGDFSKELVIATQRLVVPFKHSTIVLDRLMILLSEIRGTFSVDTENETYNFSAIFSKENPYLGLFLNTLKITSSQKINVEFKETEGVNQGKVFVTKEKVSVSTKDLHSLQAFSKKYITLSSLNLSSSLD